MTKQSLVTSEHSTDHLSLDQLKDKDRRMLEHLRELKVVRKVSNGYKTCNFVGYLPLHSKSIEILPKIFSDDTIENNERNRLSLLHILAFVSELPIKESSIAHKNIEKHPFYEIMYYLFAKKLTDELYNGIYRTYEGFESNESYLKGRLKISENIQKNFVRKDRFYVAFDDFTEDNRMNKVFAYATRDIMNSSGKLSRQYVIELLSILAEIEVDRTITKDMEKIVINRLNERFWSSYEMAKLLIKKLIPTIYSGADLSSQSFLFNMDLLFEKFVAKFLHKYKSAIFGQTDYQIHRQKPAKFGDLSIKPDIIVESDKRVIVVDTKYTSLPTKEDSKNSHLYQIYTYCMHQKQIHKNKEITGLLLYPKHLCAQQIEGNGLSPIQIGQSQEALSVLVNRGIIDLQIRKPEDLRNDFVDKFKNAFNV